MTTAVALTKTSKKTREHKTSYVDAVRSAVDASDRVYLFSYENMRSNHFKDVRLHFRGGGGGREEGGAMVDEDDDDDGVDGGSGGGGRGWGRLFLGKNKLLQVALGRTPEDEYSDNLHRLSRRLSGSVGILCTNQDAASVERYIARLSVEDYARAGAASPRTVALTRAQVESHPASMAEQFRKLGLPVEAKDGRVSFAGGREEYEVCREGRELTVEQCKILVHMGVKLAVFRIGLVCRWEKEGGAVEEF
jgi:mRNA turnover protein 4